MDDISFILEKLSELGSLLYKLMPAKALCDDCEYCWHIEREEITSTMEFAKDSLTALQQMPECECDRP